MACEKIGLDPFEIRRVNMMRDGATTHTKQKLKSVSIGRVLDVAEKASGWEKGVSGQRNGRSDLGGEGLRPAVALGARFAADTKQEAAE
jgi:CO/xanthine dehydrogenase Mo-binding subunit